MFAPILAVEQFALGRKPDAELRADGFAPIPAMEQFALGRRPDAEVGADTWVGPYGV